MIPNKDRVKVSPTQPTTGEKVWLQKGKNLLNLNVNQTKNDVTIISNSDGSITLNGTATADTRIDIPINLNLRAGTYTHSRNNITLDNTYLSLDNINDTMLNKNSTERTFTINQNTDYNYYVIWFGSGVAFDNVTLYLQLEQGMVATGHEQYIEPKIYVKNDNDVYEEFINKEDLVNYSTGETRIGTWIDGKKLYRKVLTYTGAIEADTLFKIGMVDNVETTISMNYTIRNSNGSQWINDYANAGVIKTFTLIMQMEDNYLYGLSTNESWSSPYLIVTIEYTKTTD